MDCPKLGASARRILRRIRVWKFWASAQHVLSDFCRCEEFCHVVGHFGGQPRARFVHAHDDARQPQAVIQAVGYDLDGPQQLAEPVQGQEVRLQRQEDLAHGGQGVKRQHAQRRRAIDDQEVEVPVVQRQLVAEDHLPADLAGQLQFGRRQIQVRRDQPQVVAYRHADFGQTRIPGQHVVHGLLPVAGNHAQMQGRVGLRIQVHQADPPALAGQGGAQVDGRGGLPHAAFLVDDGDRSHAIPPVGFRSAVFRGRGL